MILGWSKFTRSGKKDTKIQTKKIRKIGPNETGKWVVEILSSQLVLSRAL